MLGMYKFGAGRKTVGASAPTAPIGSAPLSIHAQGVEIICGISTFCSELIIFGTTL